jgi:hypothetical protein
MTTTAITYSTTGKRRDLRTVVVTGAREITVLAADGPIEVLTATVLHGTKCAHEWWAGQLGTDPDSNDFAVPIAQVVAIREMAVAGKPKFRGSIGPDGQLQFKEACK